MVELFAGEGGATAGYMQAGFRVIAVDLDSRALARNPAPDRHALDWQVGLDKFAARADLIHASPPCQHWSQATRVSGDPSAHPQLIAPVRAALQQTGKPYVIENVETAPLRADLTLCGSMFGLAVTAHGRTFGLRRHRIFELTFPAVQPRCDHRWPAMNVTGNSYGRLVKLDKLYKGTVAERRQLMRMPWASGRGVQEAIPPVYAAYIAGQWIASL